MGVIHMPDPHPGRCQNVRHIAHSDGQTETLRCLDYENVGHRCTFPEPTHQPSVTAGNVTYTPAAPQRWIKPSERID